MNVVYPRAAEPALLDWGRGQGSTCRPRMRFPLSSTRRSPAAVHIKLEPVQTSVYPFIIMTTAGTSASAVTPPTTVTAGIGDPITTITMSSSELNALVKTAVQEALAAAGGTPPTTSSPGGC